MESLLEMLCGTGGISGNESSVASIVKDIVRDQADIVEADSMGNVIFTKKGNGPGPTVLICAHMDEIGAMVRYVDEKGYVYFDTVGGHNAAQLLGSTVTVGYCTPGIIESKKKGSKDAIELKDLYIDIGASAREDASACGILPGSPISRSPSYHKLLGSRRASKAFDNRAGLYCMLMAFEAVESFCGTLVCAATSQEEVGTRGAAVVGDTIKADLAIAVDVTFAVDTPMSSEEREYNTKLGCGPALTLKDDGHLLREDVRAFVESVGSARSIPLQYDISKGKTDAAPLYTSGPATRTASILLPLRYMHTGHEVIDLKDAEKLIMLLKAIVEDFGRHE